MSSLIFKDIFCVLFGFASSFILGVFLAILDYPIIFESFIYGLYLYLMIKISDGAHSAGTQSGTDFARVLGAVLVFALLLGMISVGIQRDDFLVAVIGVILCGVMDILNYFRKKLRKL